MGSARKAALGAGIALGGLLLLAVLLVLVLTRTDPGREQVRRVVLDQLHERTEGRYEIGRIEGDLLHRVILIDVSVTDLQDRPFVSADTIATGYSLLSLLRRRIVLTDTRLVNAMIVLDQPPGEKWNFARIFPIEPGPPDEPPGWGDWFDIEDAELVDGHVMVRSEWEPDRQLSPVQRREAIAGALAGESRANIQQVGDGFQNVMDYRRLNARLPRVRVADPDADAMLFDIATMSGIMQPFRPPVAEVHDLVGEFRLSADSLWFSDVHAELPGSRIVGDGVYDLETAGLFLALHGQPAALADLRWLYPPLPEEGGGPLSLTLHLREDETAIFAEDADLRVRDSRLAGRLGLVLGDTVRVHDTDLRFEDLDTHLIQRVAPELGVPRHGRLTGRLALEGRPSALDVNGDVTFVDEVAGLNRVLATGVIGMDEVVRFQELRLRFDPLHAALIRDQVPQLPAGAVITGVATLDGPAAGPLRVDGDLALRDPVTGLSRVLAAGEIDPRPGDPRVRDLLLRFRPLQVDLFRAEMRDLPSGGSIEGRLRLDGPLTGMLRVDAELALRDPATGLSRVAASGGIDLAEPVGLQELDVRVDPLQVGLIERLATELPVGGTLVGTATLTGLPNERLLVAGLDLVHADRGERSHLIGTADLAFAEDRAALDLRLLPLSLSTVGRFAPEAGLRGSVAGTLEAHGTLRDLALRADLDVADGGELAVTGTLDLASERTGYQLDTRLRLFDLAAVTERAPATTALSGLVAATGRGFDPATMRAHLSADLAGPRVDDVEVDSVWVRAAIADGLAVIDTSLVRLGEALAWADGSFGLVAGRHGELAYRIAIDSLHALAPYLPAVDTGVVEPRPVVRREAIEEGRERERLAAEAREVQRLATGRQPAPPPPPVDTAVIAEVPRDSLAGSLHAAGTLSGNVERFELEGRAELEDVVFQGNYIERGRADYLLGIDSPRPTFELDAAFENVLAAGFAFDSATAHVQHRGDRHGDGRAVIAAYQADDTDYRADLDFHLALERNEVRLRELELRFDTINWVSTRPGAVSWDGRGVQVETIELRSDAGGRIFVDGRLPLEDTADLDVVLDSVHLENIVTLLQEDADVRGTVSLEARLGGTLRSPRLDGWAELVDAMHEDEELPDTRATFEYADAELVLDAELRRDELVLGTAEGRLPIDLSLIDSARPRLLDSPLSMDVRSDGIPLDALPLFTDVVDDVSGVVMGDFSVRGTFDNPVLDGAIDIEEGELRVVQTGVRYEDVAGSFRLDGQRLVVDSLVAWARGPVRVSGELDLSTLAEPGFDLEVRAERARVWARDDNRLAVDAELEVSGPFDNVSVTGEVRTRSGVLYVPEARDERVIDLEAPALMERLAPALIAERDRLFPEFAFLDNLEVDIAVHITPDTWIRATDLNVEIFTDPEFGPLALRVDRGLRRVVLEGVIRTERGEYSFMSRRFTITRGTASFIPGRDIDPLLQIVAEHEVRMAGREALEIRIVIGGTMTDPTITLESNAEPPLSQTDLLAFVAFGRPAASLMQQQGSALSGQAGGAGDLVGNVAGLASRQLASVAADVMLDEFESETARALGLDMLHIAPADLPAELFTGRFEDLLRGTRIEAGTYIGRRLFAVVQTRLTTETRPGLRLHYQTLGGFSFRTGIEPRFLSPVPTLREIDPERTSVFGAFIFREWRF